MQHAGCLPTPLTLPLYITTLQCLQPPTQNDLASINNRNMIFCSFHCNFLSESPNFNTTITNIFLNRRNLQITLPKIHNQKGHLSKILVSHQWFKTETLVSKEKWKQGKWKQKNLNKVLSYGHTHIYIYRYYIYVYICIM